MSQLIRVQVTVESSWAQSDRLLLLVGSENAASLAASTPSGGTVVRNIAVADYPASGIEYELTPADKCATLPVGVAVEDAAGNRSTIDEEVVQLSDTPQGPSNLRVSQATPGSGRALLAWDASPDVPAS